MRKSIRYSTDIPIEYLEYTFRYTEKNRKGRLKNVSEGGFSVTVSGDIKPGARLLFLIPLSKPVLKVNGIVTHNCCRGPYDYELGVKFVDTIMELRNRLIEQVRNIEEYRKEILEKEGRKLSGEEAIKGWAEKNAKDTPPNS